MDIRTLFVVFFLLMLTAGCGSGSDNVSENGTDHSADDTAIDENSTPSYTSQALLGPVVGADVAIYDATDLAAGLLCRSQTNESDEIDLAGKIQIPQECIEEDGIYLLLISGGHDIDPDDDGEIDQSPVQIKGRFHTLLSGTQLLSGSANATVLTEAAYQNVRYILAAGATKGQLIGSLDSSAHNLLNQDLNGDQVINHLDLAQWHPRFNREATKPSLDQLKLVTQAIHQDQSTAQHTVKLFDATAPSMSDFTDLQAERIWLNGETLYAANFLGLSVLDISNPDSLLPIGQVNNTTHSISDMTLVGDRLYVQSGDNAFGDHRVALYDVSTREAPQLLVDDLYRPQGFDLNKFHVSGEVGFAAVHRVNHPNDYENISHEFRLDLLDLSIPEQPALIASLEIGTYGTAMAVIGDRLYLGTGVGPYLESGALSVFDISDLTSPVRISELELNSVLALSIAGKRGYAITENEISGEATDQITLLDLSNESDIVVTGTIATHYNSRTKKQLHVQAGIGYMATPDGILMIDLSDPQGPRQLGHIITNGPVSSLAVSGSKVIAAVDNFGLQVFETSGQSVLESAAIVDRIALPDVQEIVVDGSGLAYLLAGQDMSRKIITIDQTNSQQRVVTSTEVFPEFYQNPLVIGQRLYATSMFNGVTLFDIADPQQVTLELTFDQSLIGFASAIDSLGDLAVVASGRLISSGNNGYPEFSLTVLNVSQPSDPLLMSQLVIDYQPNDLVMKNDLVYVIGSDQVLKIYRITVNHELRELSGLDIASTNGAAEILLQGEYGFLSHTDNTLSVVDISDPSSPAVVLVIDTQGPIGDIHIEDNLLLIAGQAGNLQVLNIENPEAPAFVGNYHTPSPAQAVWVINNQVFVATKNQVVISDLPIHPVP
ncbi:MAG: hypothetical protein JAY90_13995 [Candidatus Thiodiazotropha lotti]|nr:hypothetical protein [Candidatus Thiodiazotropha lotti]